jgi:long-chain acyl-CoA synthetase
VGRSLPNVEVRLSEAGELLVRGPNVMLGYWNDRDATSRVLDRDGWLHTGDLAESRDGRIAIRGRLKDILVLSNGEKLPPQDVELAILGDDTFEQILLLGEGRPFLTLLAVANEADEKALVQRANERLKAFPRYIRVRRAIVSPDPWTVENGLLTPTMKVKRNQVLKRFAPEIDAVYASGARAD